jgi:DNA-binding beta-propeller fold protein YncE
MCPANTCAALLALVLGCGEPDIPAEPTLKQSIPLKGVHGRIDHMACDPVHKRLFVAALGNGSLEVVDLEKGEVSKSVKGLKEPQGVVYVAAIDRVVVACGGDGTVRSFDGLTLEPKGKIEIGDDADNARLGPDGHSVIVGYGDGGLAILDAESLKKLGEIKLGGHPESFQVEAAGGRVIANVPGGLVGGGGEVVVAELASRRVVARWKLTDAGRNFPMAFDAAGKRVFVGCRRPSRLVVLDAETGKGVSSLECVGDADDVFVDAKTGAVYVIGGDGTMDVFERKQGDAWRRTASVKTAPAARTGLLVPEMRAMFVAAPERGEKSAEIRRYDLPDPAPRTEKHE